VRAGSPSREEREPTPNTAATEDIFWPLRPLIWINNIFDRVVGCAGAPGRWLAGPSGKSLLGVVGLICLVVALGLFAFGWLGWTW